MGDECRINSLYDHLLSTLQSVTVRSNCRDRSQVGDCAHPFSNRGNCMLSGLTENAAMDNNRRIHKCVVI